MQLSAREKTRIWYFTASLSLEFKNSADWLFTQQKNIKDSPMFLKGQTQRKATNTFYRSEISESKACKQVSYVSLHQSITIYNFLQVRSLGLLETNSLRAFLCMCVSGHTQACTNIEITAEKWLEAIIKIEAEYNKCAVWLQHIYIHIFFFFFVFLLFIPSCVSFPNKVLSFPSNTGVVVNISVKNSRGMSQKRNTFVTSCK